MTGEVILVGGGPGDPGLLTVAGLAALKTADVIVYDRLAPLAVLDECDAELIGVGKIPRGPFTPQDRINQVLVEHATAGKTVVRFKGGDSFVFGRGGEEWDYCVAHGVPVRVIPGVTSAVAVPELAGIPVTHRSLTQGFITVSGHIGPSHPDCTVNWAALAQANLTIVILMGVQALPEITATLIASGLDASTPAAVIADGGLPTMRVVRADLAGIAAAAHDAEITPPAITVIGDVTTALKEFA